MTTPEQRPIDPELATSADPVLILERISAGAVQCLRDAGLHPVLAYEDEDWQQLAPVIRAIIVRGETWVDGDLLDRFPALEVVGKPGAGTDKIDVVAATARGIRVTNTPGANAGSVAELAVGLLCAATRDIVVSDAAVRHGRFDDRRTMRMRREITGTRLGLIGAGRIGRRVAEICRGGFGCTIGAYDPFVDALSMQALEVQTFRSVGQLFEWADNIVVAAPLTSRTRGLVGKKELGLLGPRGVIVCSSRGGIVEEVALAEALDAGLIHGAALDVFDPEPPRGDNPLFRIDRVVLSPHVGSLTEETTERMFVEVCRHVASLLAGGQAPLVGTESWR